MLSELRELTDEQLILGCRGAPAERGRELVGELAERYFERIAGFIYGLTGDQAVAQDLAQEAFVRVYRHREVYKEVARFSTWLYTIARNLALNEVRNRKNRPRLSLDHAARPGAEERSEAAPLGAQAAPGATPLEAAAAGDLQALVRREVEALSEHHRVVVVLCDLEGRPYADAAQILGVPIGTIRSRLSRAREHLERRLRPLLEELESGGGALA